MPLLAFCCKDCGEIFEELVPSADAYSITCRECGGKVERHYQGKALFGMIGNREQTACAPCGHAGTGCGHACQR